MLAQEVLEPINETSASGGLVWHWRPGHQAFVNAATAFETPTFAEFANPAGTGGFNPGLDPQNARSAEAGVRGDAGMLAYDLTAYTARVDDELVPFQVEGGGRTYYRNAGRTAREGLEIGLELRPAPQWNLRAAASLNHFRYREFTVDNIRINANFGRYFEPAPGRNFLAGLRLYYRP